MVIAILNTTNTIKVRLSQFASPILGVFENRKMLMHVRSFPVMKFPYFTANFNHFESNIFGNNQQFTYHLSGYGVLNNEALMSLIGEGAERFSFVSQYKLVKRKKYSYKYLEENMEPTKFLEWSYINIFQTDHFNLSKNDEIDWVKMYNIKTYEDTLVPAQMVMPAVAENDKSERKFLKDTVSTGTASHETFAKSTESAVIEILQLDSFNMWWYMGYKPIEIKVNMKEKLINYGLDKHLEDFLDNFDVTILDISFDKGIHIIAVEIESVKDDLPKYTVGLGAGYSFEYTIYRAFMEAITIVEYNLNVPWQDSEYFKSITSQTNFSDLDSNVIYYAKKGRPNLQYNQKSIPLKTKKVTNLKDLIATLPDETNFLNITPPDFRDSNNVVVRVVSPMLLPMCMPNYPPIHHPRYKENPILNKIPHPLP